MKIAAPASMLEGVTYHFKKAGHGFELEEPMNFACTKTGHEITIARSRQLMDYVDDDAVDLALVGSDILKERQFLRASRGELSPALHTLATYEGYGRQFITPQLITVARRDSGVESISPGMVIATEHPFTLKKYLEFRGLTPARLGADHGVPLTPGEFRGWSLSRGCVGIWLVDGKEPGALNVKEADAATMVNESGRTVDKNGLVVLDVIESISMNILANQRAVREHEGVILPFVESLDRAHLVTRKEFEASQGSPERV